MKDITHHDADYGAHAVTRDAAPEGPRRAPLRLIASRAYDDTDPASGDSHRTGSTPRAPGHPAFSRRDPAFMRHHVCAAFSRVRRRGHYVFHC